MTTLFVLLSLIGLSINSRYNTITLPAVADAGPSQWVGMGAGWRPELQSGTCRQRYRPYARPSSPWTRTSSQTPPTCCLRASRRWGRKQRWEGCNRSSWCSQTLPSWFPQNGSASERGSQWDSHTIQPYANRIMRTYVMFTSPKRRQLLSETNKVLDNEIIDLVKWPLSNKTFLIHHNFDKISQLLTFPLNPNIH